jgi:hypothetical protein
MFRYVLITILGLIIEASAEFSLTAEGDFSGIRGLDSLCNP